VATSGQIPDLIVIRDVEHASQGFPGLGDQFLELFAVGVYVKIGVC